MFKLYNSKVAYQVFLRDFTAEGNISAFIKRLDYIKSLGVDAIQLLPINPIGKLGRKGTIGSPYSISDYESINPDFGSMKDFSLLVKEIHSRGLSLILDMVFNHCANDSVLLKSHPDFFLRDKKGNLIRKCKDWSDVTDLDHDNKELEDYLVKVLSFYVSLGVDGFRFDVASLIKPSFFKKAKQALKKQNKNICFIGEAVDTGFILYLREQGYKAYSNEELVSNGVDIVYHYASWHYLKQYLHSFDSKELEAYKAAFNVEASSIEEKGSVMRAIENHDYPRINSYTSYPPLHDNLLAFSFFTRGPAFIYNGEECQDEVQPSLFEKETILFNKPTAAYATLFQALIKYKHEENNNSLLVSTCLESSLGTLLIKNTFKNQSYQFGLFNLTTKPIQFTSSCLIDGKYQDYLTKKEITIKDHTLTLNEPLFLIPLSK